MKHLFTLCLLFVSLNLSAQTPQLSSWLLNTTGQTGYKGYASNVQQVAYTATNVYVSCSCIPGYDIGPWQNNPNTPVPENFVFKITRSPQKNTGTPVQTPLGHTGVWTNGVSIFNAKDGMSYNNQGVWNRDALYWEGISFDNCLGHPAPNGEYHHHVSPTCLYNDKDSTHHSPIIGYAFDGFPIYGAYGYANIDGTGAIQRMRSSYVLSVGATRNNGPAVSASYPAGCFIEDFTYTANSGTLDEHNGRFCVTPEYPSGTYAYFVTIDANRKPVYPYTAGPTYYGTVQQGNTGPGGGHNTVPANATVYTPTSTTPTINVSNTSLSNCEGSILSFKAIITLGGSTPTYRWYVNGQQVGTDSDVFSSSTLKTKDRVWCVLNSNDASANPQTVTSNVVQVELYERVRPTITYAAAVNTILCENSSIDASCFFENGGSIPDLRWMLNGKVVSTTQNLMLSSLKTGDSLWVELRSTAPCALDSVVRTATLHFVVHPLPATPTITQIGSILRSSEAKSYQWFRDGIMIVGARSRDYLVQFKGSYRVMVGDSNKCGSVSDPIEITTTDIKADDESELVLSDIVLQPHPVQELLCLNTQQQFRDISLRIIDALGRVVYSAEHLNFDASQPLQLALGSEYAPGLYCLQLQNNRSIRCLRFIKN